MVEGPQGLGAAGVREAAQGAGFALVVSVARPLHDQVEAGSQALEEDLRV